MYLYSYVAGFAIWLICLATLSILWGNVWMIVGLFFAGVGVVPLACVALLFNGEWLLLGVLLIVLVIIFACRIGGIAAVGSADNGSLE